MKVKILTQIAEENKLLFQLNKEVKKAKKAIIAVSFMQRAGLNLFFDHIREILNRNKKVEIFTSGYMGITDPKALKSLLQLSKIYGDLLKVYFKPTHKFHAKYFFFERPDKSYCVFLGSSNISETGLSEIGELNVKIIGKHNDSIHKDLKIVIDNLKKDREFKLLNQEQIEIYQRNYKKEIRFKNKLSNKNKSPKIKEVQHIQRMVKIPIFTFYSHFSHSDQKKYMKFNLNGITILILNHPLKN